MAEPHSTVIAGAIVGAGAGSVTILMGAKVDALAIGLVAAILASIWLETIDSRAKAASAVLLSAILAGYGSPVAAEYIAASVTGIGMSDPLRLLLAALIGLASPRIVPIAMRVLASKAGA